MVFFICDHCQTSLKKQKVDGHKSSCKGGSTVSCVDCSVVFHGRDYASHTSCISEAEKYEGALYQGKKTGKKNPQEEWIENLKLAMNEESDSQVRNALERITEYDNCPKKQKQFVNFVKNSLRLPEHVVSKTWTSIEKVKARLSEERIKIQDEKKKKVELAKEKKEEEKIEKKNNDSSSKKRKRSESDNEENSGESENKKQAVEESKFSWKKSITACLKKQATKKQMKLKELRGAVVKMYKENQRADESNNDDVNELFNKNLIKLKEKSKITENGKYIILVE